MVSPQGSGDPISTIAELVSTNQPVTLAAIGGIDAIPRSMATSPMFPYVANALVTEWISFSSSQREVASELIEVAIKNADSGLALNDTCQAIVPAVADLGIEFRVKEALRIKAVVRKTSAQGALAAIAIRWLTHLAAIAPTVRPALLDVLSGIALDSKDPEPTEFAPTAAQIAGIAHDFWRDQIAADCLVRLTNSNADSDSWFGLGQARLVHAFEADSSETLIAGLMDALECFDNATIVGEDRPDAMLYVHIIRFVREFVNRAPTEMLEKHVQEAEFALRQYILGSTGLPDQPMWYRPTFAAENAWIIAVNRIHHANKRATCNNAWYEPAILIGALSEAYVAANTLSPLRYDSSGTVSSEAFVDLMTPRLTAPFLEDLEKLEFVREWVAESDSPNAEAFEAFVRLAIQDQSRRGSSGLEEVPPNQRPPGHTRR